MPAALAAAADGAAPAAAPAAAPEDPDDPATAGALSDEDALRELVPDLVDHDVYLCGADGWMDAAERALLAAGVPGDAIHAERFTW